MLLPEDKPRQTPLSEALDSLNSEDVAPAWKADTAWPRIEARIEKRRRIPLWSYPLAAAAALLLCVMLLRPAAIKAPSNSGELTAAKDAHSLEKKALKTSPAIPAPQPADVAVSKVSNPAIIAPKKKAEKAFTPEEIVAVVHQEKEQPMLKDTTPFLATQSRNVPSYNRAPVVIYTLSEIMADVPEREAPPKRYSGLFHGKPSADAPDNASPRRRSGRGAYEAPGSPAIIIIN